MPQNKTFDKRTMLRLIILRGIIDVTPKSGVNNRTNLPLLLAPLWVGRIPSNPPCSSSTAGKAGA